MKPEETNLKAAMELLSDYEKSPMQEKFENFEKNLRCIRDVTGRLTGCMKGHGVSFRREITDGKGEFSGEKLSALVEGLLALWADRQREGAFADPSTGESMAEPYIQERRELYGLYLYLAMRCSLEKGGYTLSRGGELEERTDFAFLLEQARGLLDCWCVLKCPDGGRRNELLPGYDFQFGFHLYSVLTASRGNLDRAWDWPESEPLAFLTDEGSVKRNRLREIYCGRMPLWLSHRPKDAAQGEEGAEEAVPDDHDDDACWFDEDFSSWTHDMDAMYAEADGALREADAERRQREDALGRLESLFEDRAEYIEKCERFAALFRRADAAVLRGFCDDLEEMADLYLVKRDLAPLSDTDQALTVYSSIYDEAFQQAKMYERGVRWKTV